MAIKSDYRLPTSRPKNALAVFGTRPEVIKLAPIIRELAQRRQQFRIINVQTSQQADLVGRLQAFFGLETSYDLEAMRGAPALNDLCARVIAALDPIISDEQPDVVLVQGDTTTALAGALAARHRRVPVAHVEAGLRTNDPDSPFPEENNRRLITQLASFSFRGDRAECRDAASRRRAGREDRADGQHRRRCPAMDASRDPAVAGGRGAARRHRRPTSSRPYDAPPRELRRDDAR